MNRLLAGLEHMHGVEVLFAIESGSRAWGFASPMSDFDVRFVYRLPAHRAFRLNPERENETIDRKVPASGADAEADLVGWSLEKALKLGGASNPQFVEWAGFVQPYRAEPAFHAAMRELAALSRPRVLAKHYRGLAKRTLMTYLDGEDPRLGKKYLYAVRPLLAAAWMIDNPHRGVTPPIRFAKLLDEVLLPAAVRYEMDELLDWKTGPEAGRGPRRFVALDKWLPSQIDRLEGPIAVIPEHDPREAEELAGRLHRALYAELGQAEPQPLQGAEP